MSISIRAYVVDLIDDKQQQASIHEVSPFLLWYFFCGAVCPGSRLAGNLIYATLADTLADLS
ncbi:hypothetical protein H0A66_00145 [Alcaligenaceae bacterium]|nr:hypothetical protein [Alcaligenaceae bacterium]